MPERVRARTGGKRRSPAVTPRTPRTASDLGTGRLTRCVKRPSKQRVVQLAGAAARVTDSLGLRRTQARRLGKRVGDSSRSRPARERPSDELSDNRHRQRRTPVDAHGRSAASHACCGAGAPCRNLASGRRGQWFGSCGSSQRCPVTLSGPLAAEFSRTRSSGAAARRRVRRSPRRALALGGPARPGRAVPPRPGPLIEHSFGAETR